MKKLLVIGASGFIGRHIAKAAIKENYQVYGTHRSALKVHDQNISQLRWIKCNLDVFDSIDNAMLGIEIVIHAAGFFPRSKSQDTLEYNLAKAKSQTENVIKAAKNNNVKKLIFTSSFSTIAKAKDGEFATEKRIYKSGDLEESIYHEVKILMEDMLFSDTNSIPTVALNPTAVFGPDDFHLSIGKLLLMFAKGKGIFWIDSLINIVDVRDVAKAHISAIENGKPGEKYIIGGHNFEVKDWIAITNQILGFPNPWLKIPHSLINLLIFAKKAIPLLPIPTNHLSGLKNWSFFDNSKAIEGLNLTIMPYEQTVLDTKAWFQENNLL